MIYALIVLLVVQQALIGYVVTQARQERADLEDRLMSTFTPVALVQHKSMQDTEPGDVSYVDEAREAELSPSWSPAP